MPAIVSDQVQSRNPLGQRTDRFRRGRLLLYTRRQDVTPARTAEPGVIRRWVHGLAGYTGGPPPLSWTRNAFAVDHAAAGPVSTPERFLISQDPAPFAGNQRSNPMLRPIVASTIRYPPPSLTWVGNQQNRPTVRQRIRTLGARVAPANPPLPGGDVQTEGQ